ncbi:transposase [Mesorhizobium ciceri]|uniref:transposase n=1 Tax=Mesorhizobium TaxID=68287 RepID=UPI001FD9B08F|nr:transposase [Mesorhizobium ciceri]
MRAKGGTPRIVATGMWGRDEAATRARLEAWNQPIHRIRGPIEKIFGTWKRSYGFRRMRWRGLAKAGVQIRLTAIAYNMKRGLKVMVIAIYSGKNTIGAHTRASKPEPTTSALISLRPLRWKPRRSTKINAKSFQRTGLPNLSLSNRFVPTADTCFRLSW